MKDQFAKNWPASILIAAVLSLAFQPVIAETMTMTMTSSHCAETSAMAGHDAMAGHSEMAGEMNCCDDSNSSSEHECGNLCFISCMSSAAADIPFNAATFAAPSRLHHDTDAGRPPLQFAAAFIPPPPRT